MINCIFIFSLFLSFDLFASPLIGDWGGHLATSSNSSFFNVSIEKKAPDEICFFYYGFIFENSASDATKRCAKVFGSDLYIQGSKAGTLSADAIEMNLVDDFSQNIFVRAQMNSAGKLDFQELRTGFQGSTILHKGVLDSISPILGCWQGRYVNHGRAFVQIEKNPSHDELCLVEVDDYISDGLPYCFKLVNEDLFYEEKKVGTITKTELNFSMDFYYDGKGGTPYDIYTRTFKMELLPNGQVSILDQEYYPIMDKYEVLRGTLQKHWTCVSDAWETEK